MLQTAAGHVPTRQWQGAVETVGNPQARRNWRRLNSKRRLPATSVTLRDEPLCAAMGLSLTARRSFENAMNCRAIDIE